MAHPKAAWGIEIGAFAIKAVRLEREGDRIAVSDFSVIPHKKVLTTPDVDKDEMVRLSLGQLISQKPLEGEHLVMSVPGHAAFARFAKLPPVEAKKVPDIVKFEAVQQIPFPIDEVEWDYQTFQSTDSPEIEVGIFAITRERVQHRLGLYSELGLAPESLTLSPVSVFNAMTYDRELGETDGPVVFLDIGTSATDVIIADRGRCWIRTFPLGGTHFTEAIAETFKLSYSKAEKLKHEASTSKYAKQIMQAMRPVFSDLLQDLQRSIGYYQTLHPDVELETMVGLGSTFKIPGLRKFLGQQLQVNVLRLDEYKKISVTGREAASFAENAVNMATAYGLALQGLGVAAIDANLVPVGALRDQIWHQKTKWFAAAAAIVIAGSAMMLYRPIADQAKLRPGGPPPVVQNVLAQGKSYKDRYQQLEQDGRVGYTTTNVAKLLDYRTIWPHLINDSAQALATADPQEELLNGGIEQIMAVPPEERRLILLDRLDGDYVPPTDPQDPRLMDITLVLELSHNDPNGFLNQTVARWLRENAERPGLPYRIVRDTVSINPDALVEDIVTPEGMTRRRSETAPGGRQRAPETRQSQPQLDPRGGSGTLRGDGPTINIPGSGGGDNEFSTGGAGTGSTGAPSNPGGSPGGRGSRPGGGGFVPPSRDGDAPGAREAGFLPFHQAAPTPQKPLLYPVGSRVYRATVTFQIEILPPDAEHPQDQSAQGTQTTGDDRT